MKLLVSDIDGTLYWYNKQNNKGVSDKCRTAIRNWMDAGNRFAVATARVHTVRDAVMDDLQMNIDYLGGNGAEIIFFDGSEKFHSLPVSYFLEAGKWIDENHINATVKMCVDHQFITYRHDNYPFACESRMRMNLRRSVPYQSIELNDLSTGVNMSVLTHPDVTKQVESELQKLFEGRCIVQANDIDNIDFIPLKVGKDKAILQLAEHYGISMKDVIVIGDAANDICMFEITENSYCMSHSDITIQKKASFVVDLVEEAIERELKKMGDLNNE
ncbi:MAG: HAD family phosphatase [Erysipelotrichaceae bacterium]|nr:HAD family phosphatase [Erysipelotrichaceae bacterium]